MAQAHLLSLGSDSACGSLKSAGSSQSLGHSLSWMSRARNSVSEGFPTLFFCAKRKGEPAFLPVALFDQGSWPGIKPLLLPTTYSGWRV